MKGINWTKIIIPLIVIASPIHFNSCDISYSSFYEMKLPSISIINCKAHEVDLRGSDISMSDLSATDFEGSQFNNTNLVNTDLRNAIHYSINPMENEIKQAKFSLPEVIGLLDSFEIEIDECN